jgi:hypothetical protein
MTENPNTPLRRDQAAEYIRINYGFPCSRSWLAKLATCGGGPVFRKASRFPLYDKVDLDAWAQNKIGPRMQSTAERSAAQ